MSVADSLARNPAVGGVLAIGLVGGAVYYLFGDRIAAWLKGALNPLSNENLAYRGAGALTGTDDNFGGWLHDVLNPLPGAGAVFFMVQFPDGSTHSVSSADVAGDRFTRAGVTYQLRSDQAGRYAVPIAVQKQTGGATGYW